MMVVAEAWAAAMPEVDMVADPERTKPSAASAGAWRDTSIELLLLPGKLPRLPLSSLKKGIAKATPRKQ